MAKSTSYRANDYLPLGSEQAGSHYIFFWDPELYIELFEYARLAKNEGFLLPDYPFFTDIEKHSLFKIWFSSNYKFFAVKKMYANSVTPAGITLSRAKKGFTVNFDKDVVSVDQAIAFIKELYEIPIEDHNTFQFSLPMQEIRKRSKEKLVHKLSIDWEDSDNQVIVEGLLPVQRHKSRERVAYQAYTYFQKLLKDSDADDDLIRVYVAHSLGFFANGGQHDTQKHWSKSLEMKIEQHRQIKNGTYVKKEFSFNGKLVTQQWLTYVDTKKSKVADLIKDCIETFVCLGEGVFPKTPEKCEELGDLDSYTEAAAKNKKEIKDFSNYGGSFLTFVKKRIKGLSIFSVFQFNQPHAYTNGFLKFQFNPYFRGSPKKSKLDQLDKLITQIQDTSEEQAKKFGKLNFNAEQWITNTKLLATAQHMLSLMRGYIEDELWFNDKENDPAEHIMAFEVEPAVGKALEAIYGSTSNK